ncbi:MAG: hypothetical protein NTZ59_12215, partial [Bacteroidetes bacterium]|nr:hypothetical protein [Bacteroidota bacterium]
MVTFSAFKANAQTILTSGDVMVCGWNNNSVNGYKQIQVVLLKAISSGTVFKIAATGFNSNSSTTFAYNARANTGISKWTSSTALPVGTVITISNDGTNIASDIGTMSNIPSSCGCGANGSPVLQNTNGGRFFIYQGTSPGDANYLDFSTTSTTATFYGTPLSFFGFQGTQSGYTGFLGTGTATSIQTYLPSDLVGNSIFHSNNAIGGYFNPSRSGYTTVTALRAALLTTSNWTTASGSSTVTIPSGNFTLGTTPSFTGSSTLNACSAGAA